MSKLLVKHMHSKGCTRMTILNRSLPRAEALAEEFPDVTFDIHLMGDLMKVRGGGCGWVWVDWLVLAVGGWIGVRLCRSMCVNTLVWGAVPRRI